MGGSTYPGNEVTITLVGMSRERIEMIGDNLMSWGEQLASEGTPVIVWSDSCGARLFEANEPFASVVATTVFYESRLQLYDRFTSWHPVS